MVGHVGELGLKFLRSLFKLILSPKQITQTEVHIGLLWVSLYGSAKLLNGPCRIVHFIESFAGQHVGSGLFCVQSEDLPIGIEDAVKLAG